jgi:hypothetical protein
MANLARVRVNWTGSTVVGPGVNTLFFDEATSGWVAALGTFLTAISSRIPAGTVIDIPNTGELIDASNGNIVGSWTDGASSPHITPSASANFAHGVGGAIVWGTAGRRNNRPIRGRTFIVPLLNTQYGPTGQIDAAAVSAIQSSLNTFNTAQLANLRIWSRPKAGSGGFATVATSGLFSPDVAWLRSRKT